MQRFSLIPGASPLLVSVPHAGTHVPDAIRKRLTPAARSLPDTDWFVDRLYDFAPTLGAGLLRATHSRYVVDLNRPPDDGALYPGQDGGLLPRRSFDGDPVYRDGEEPGPDEVVQRRTQYWKPYHRALEHELSRLRERHGHAVLLDAHSIRSRLPLLFDGRLPALNLGSNRGRSAGPELIGIARGVLEDREGADFVLDGRFIGGFITRHYGRPERGCHALQLEMAQRLYMREEPPGADEEAAERARPILRELVAALIHWHPA